MKIERLKIDPWKKEPKTKFDCSRNGILDRTIPLTATLPKQETFALFFYILHRLISRDLWIDVWETVFSRQIISSHKIEPVCLSDMICLSVWFQRTSRPNRLAEFHEIFHNHFQRDLKTFYLKIFIPSGWVRCKSMRFPTDLDQTWNIIFFFPGNK